MRYLKDKLAGAFLVLAIGLSTLIIIGCAAASAPASAPTPKNNTSGASSTAKTTQSAPQGNNVTIDLVAQNIAFDLKTITVPAGAAVTINFNNKDSGIPHNFSLYTDSSANPPAIFQGQIINGVATINYKFTAPAKPGTYFFRCDVHPATMIGSFVVQ